MRKIILYLLCFPAISIAHDTGYESVTEIKVFKTIIDIKSSASTVCPNENHTERYLLDKNEKEMYSLLLTAMASGKKANLMYSCDESGYSVIEGVRVR